MYFISHCITATSDITYYYNGVVLKSNVQMLSGPTVTRIACRCLTKRAEVVLALRCCQVLWGKTREVVAEAGDDSCIVVGSGMPAVMRLQMAGQCHCASPRPHSHVIFTLLMFLCSTSHPSANRALHLNCSSFFRIQLVTVETATILPLF